MGEVKLTRRGGSGKYKVIRTNAVVQQAFSKGDTALCVDFQMYEKITSPAIVPGKASALAVSPDGMYMAVGDNDGGATGGLLIYKREAGGGYSFLKRPTPSPPNSVTRIAYSPDGVHLAVVYSVSPYLSIFRCDGDEITKLPNPSSMPNDVPYGVAFSPDGRFMALARQGSPYVMEYTRNEDTFTKVPNPSTLPNAPNCVAVAFSPNSMFMILGGTSGSSTYSLSGYALSDGDTRHGTSIGATGTNSSQVNDLAFSPDGSLLMFAGSASGIAASGIKAPKYTPPLSYHEASAITLAGVYSSAKLTNVAFSPDGEYIGMGISGTGRVCVYKINSARKGLADIHIDLGSLDASSYCGGVAFTADGEYFISVTSTGDKIQVYRRVMVRRAQPYTTAVDVDRGRYAGAGYVLGPVDQGESVNVDMTVIAKEG